MLKALITHGVVQGTNLQFESSAYRASDTWCKTNNTRYQECWLPLQNLLTNQPNQFNLFGL